MAIGINLKLPFEETTEGGVFAVNKSTEEALRDDLVALLTTKRFQRPMEGNLYSPVYDYIMEPMDDIMKSDLKQEIIEKVAEIIPEINIKKIKFTDYPNDNLLEIFIVFNLKDTFSSDQTVTINISTDNN